MMEPGRFQDFCLHFLPCLADRFEGLERHGHTSGGKTRPGVPDLIKTLDSGMQIAVECGTEEGYWGPVENVADLKPYKDIVKCLKTLEAPIEIVAVSNREVPRGAVNVKSQISRALRPSPEVRITLIDVGEISDFLDRSVEDPRVKRLLGDYCPNITDIIKALEDQQKFQIAQDVARVQRPDVASLLGLAGRAAALHFGADAAREFVLRELQALSRCRISAIPPFRGVQRESIERLALASPGGRIWILLGLPKIGKSSLLLELIPQWAEFDIRLFDIPVDDADQCVVEISSELLGTVLPEEDLSPLIRSRLQRREILSRARLPARPVLVVIDNADHLSQEGLRQISEILGDLKQADVIRTNGLSCVFLTSKPLTALATADCVVAAPIWTAVELRRLLEEELGGVPGPANESDSYVSWLVDMSGGHPLFGLALAKKCANLSELVTSSLGGLPALGSEDLSREVQSFLYNELLADSDSQNFVQRLSILIGRQEMEVLNAIRRVEPPIHTSVGVLMDRFSGSLLDGNTESGYSVPPVFREIAKQRIEIAERQSVFREVSRVLLQPEGNVIHSERAISGIMHAILGEDVHSAMKWTVFLMMAILKKAPPKEQLEAILERLTIVGIVTPRDDFRGQFMQTMAQMALAMGFERIGDLPQAAKLLGRMKFDAVPTGEDRQLAKEKNILRSASIVFRAFCLAGQDPPAALEALEGLGSEDLADTPADSRKALLTLLHGLIGGCTYTEDSSALIRRVLAELDETDAEERHSALLLASSVALRAKSDDLAKIDLEDVFGKSSFGMLLHSFCRGTFLLETDREIESLDEIESSLQIAHDMSIESGPDLARLQLTKGDAAFRAKMDPIATDAYARAAEAAARDTFEYAWASWRLGVLKQDEELLFRGATAFKSAGLDDMWGRATGARGALLVKAGNSSEGLRCLASVVEAYFGDGTEKTGPSAAVALAHITRLKAQLANESLSKEEEFPPFETTPYETVISTALPRSGPTIAFFNVAETLRVLGVPDEAMGWFRRAIYSEPSETDLVCLSVLVERVVEGLLSHEFDEGVLQKCAELLLLQDRAGAFIARSFLAWCFFHACDAELERTQKTDGMRLILKALEGALAPSSLDESFWTAEISLRRALIAEAEGQESSVARHLRKALESAQRANNGSVLMAAGHRLGFELASYASSIREAAELQFAVVRGIELQRTEYNRVLTVGRNLYSFWRHCDFRRLSEYDLKAKKLLKDSATEMDRDKVPDNIAEVVMLLLLCKLYEHHGPCVEYLLAERPVSLETLPTDVQEKLGRQREHAT